MEFRTRREVIDGETFVLRELSGLSVEAAQKCEGETRQGYALIALSLVDPQTSLVRYSTEMLDAGVGYVMGLPTRIAQQLTEAVHVLNAADMDDARKN